MDTIFASGRARTGWASHSSVGVRLADRDACLQEDNEQKRIMGSAYKSCEQKNCKGTVLHLQGQNGIVTRLYQKIEQNA